LRKAAKLSQAELGSAIGVSRFTINRLEAGTIDLRADVASQIEGAVEAEGLVALVARRDQLAESAELRSSRDILLRRLLRTPGLQRVRIVLADDLDVHRLLADNSAVADARIELIVPTAVRERQLFHGQPIYGHVENQIKRVNEINDNRDGYFVEVFESPEVLFPAVMIRSPAGMECAYWPVVPSGGLVEGEDLEAVSSLEARTTARIDAHIDAVKAEASAIRRNDALAVVDPVPRPEGVNRPIIFTRFNPGSDPDELGDGEALVVALVVIHTVCPRRDLGIKRRMVVYRREDAGKRWSLPGHSVEEIDVRRARRVAEGGDFEDLSRSSSDSLAATLNHAPYFERSEGQIPIEVFKEAASRWLFAAYGIEVHIDRLENIVLPAELQQISKVRDDDDRPPTGRIVPRLFSLDLGPTALRGGSSAHELNEIKKRADVEEWGHADFDEHKDLNHFLIDANDSGFLADLCRDLGVAER
jgi:transcriptional regulator with XRE-family HTH domain